MTGNAGGVAADLKTLRTVGTRSSQLQFFPRDIVGHAGGVVGDAGPYTSVSLCLWSQAKAEETQHFWVLFF